jgi:hypothetical protein
LADVEPGFQPGGKSVTAKIPSSQTRTVLLLAWLKSGRQDAVLYGRLEACRHDRIAFKFPRPDFSPAIR